MNILDKIVAQKKIEVAQLYKELAENDKHPLYHETKLESKSFQNALHTKGKPSVIAEIKRKSPSRGNIADIVFPELLALNYAEGGAAAISVLTDSNAFGGTLYDLKAVRRALDDAQCRIPILRKDFIVDTLQLRESIQAGAQSVLLIASVLQQELAKFIRESEDLGVESLVEIHSREELELALDAGAKIIGVNQRNLKTFEMCPEIFEELAPYFPSEITRVAESGIFTREDSKKAADLGYHAVLVGEALVRSSDAPKHIQELSGFHD